MNITQETVDNFVVGHGGADASDKPIVAPGYARKAYKGVYVRAATANTIVIYVGNDNVTASDGYPLPAGEEVLIPIENPSKVFVVATPANNCSQTVALSGHIAGDTFTLTFEGATTSAISVTANSATVQTALQALSTIGAGNCSVTDTAGGPPYTVEFTGSLQKTDVSLLVGIGSGVNEKQTIAIDDASSGGSFTLTYSGQTTGAIAYSATAEDVASALKALSTIGDNDVEVTGGPGPGTDWTVEFKGALALTNVGALTGDGLLLVGGATTVTITEAQTGDNGCTVTVAKTADITIGSQYSWLSC